MNVMPPEKKAALLASFSRGIGVRASAREIGCNRGTATKYRRQWVQAELQRAYDVLWEGDGEACDAITARLPEKDVRAMLDCWLDDYSDTKGPKSKWHGA